MKKLVLLLFVTTLSSCMSNREKLIKETMTELTELSFEYSVFFSSTFNRSQIEPKKLDDLLIKYTGKNYLELESLYSDQVPDNKNPLKVLGKRMDSIRENEFNDLTDIEREEITNKFSKDIESMAKKFEDKEKEFNSELEKLSTYEFGHFIPNEENINTSMVDESISYGDDDPNTDTPDDIPEPDHDRVIFYKINDPDGYSNLRERPNGKIIRRVLEDEEFEVIGTENNHKKVLFDDGSTGYIHQSRVIEVEDRSTINE